MQGPILETKLYLPLPRSEVVRRDRLIDRLNEGWRRGLTLVSAPAGFGKTTLVGQWAAAGDRPVAWLQLDAGDNDPARFLVYVIAALQTIDPTLGATLVADLESAPAPVPESLLTALLNDIAALPEDVALVLDDYHLADARPIAQILGYLLAHVPPRMHLVIITREDPQLPLARLRAHNQLAELRARDLRFTTAEVAEFLNEVMGLGLGVDEVRTLARRTEGWIAGLQLAALSMQGRDDVQGFIKAFAGDNRYIVDYLVEEVLRRQPQPRRRFLLQTSILSRLTGPLCDAVTGRDDGGTLLTELERQNLFVVPLDDKRCWYRYHHLFADVLRARASVEEAVRLPELHERASAWYAAHDAPVDAVRHAQSAGNFGLMADLLERAWPDMETRYEVGLWLGLAEATPEDVIAQKPMLCVAYARALVQRGMVARVADLLDTAERWLDVRASGARGDGPEPAPELAALIAATRAYHAQATGDVAATMAHGRRALDLVPADDLARRGSIAALLSMAYVETGDLSRAASVLSEGLADLRRAGQILAALRGTYILADIALAQGRLRDAIDIYEQALALAEAHGPSVLRGTPDLHLRLGELYYEQHNLDAARACEQQAATLGEDDASPHWRYRLHLAQARLEFSRGDLDETLVLLDDADRLYVPTPVPDVRPIAAMRARVWIAQGRLAEAAAWAEVAGLSVDATPSFLHEFEYLTLARLLLAQYRVEPNPETMARSLGLLGRLETAAETGGRNGSLIEILILLALAHEAKGDIGAALGPLAQALALAEPEGYVRRFIGEGPAMARLLSEAATSGVAPAYARKLLAAAEGEGVGDGASDAPFSQPLIEPLTDRELEILRLIAEGLSNREIAERLYIAIPTVKGHNRNTYGKLGVRRRTEAVARARELGLL